MSILYIITTILFLLSLIASREKTFKALQVAWQKFMKLLIPFLSMLIMVSVLLYFVPNELILEWLGQSSGYKGLLIGALLGSISLMPGFIAYPIAGVLIKQGVAYMSIAAFATTLMMVGLLTYPLEKAYLGTKATIIRNISAFLISIIVSIGIGILYGELL